MTTMSRPASVNFRLYPHATFSALTVLLDADQQPVDLSGYSARLQMKRDRYDKAPIYTLTTENGGISLGAAGEIQITIPAGLTAPVLVPAIDPDGEVWYHDLLLSSPAPDPTVERLYQGTVSVFPGVTSPPFLP